MSWEIEYTNQFEEWWNRLDENEQDSIAVVVGLLEAEGAHLTLVSRILPASMEHNTRTCAN